MALERHIRIIEENENIKLINDCAFAFRKTPNEYSKFHEKIGIFSNAEKHRNKKIILNIDLENFFESFHFGRIKGFFNKNKYFSLDEKISKDIANLVCYKGVLPQGSPTSPIITNLICNILDIGVRKLSKKYKFTYTRYADDLTFSSNDSNFVLKYQNLYDDLKLEIENNGFKINEKKTRICYSNLRQTVTGIIVNKKINIPKEYYKETRAMANNFYKNDTFFIKNKFDKKEEDGTQNQLEGRFSFINQIDWYNNSKNILTVKNELKETNKKNLIMNGREKEYQKFLFYKYFFKNKKPLIITEGKTDILYLKAAIKSFKLDKIDILSQETSFLRKSKRLKYFLGIDQDGSNFCNDFIKKKYKDENSLYDYFNNITHKGGSNPVIFIYDNEFNKKGSPINQIENNLENSLKEKTNSNQYWIRISNKYNLYILVVSKKTNMDSKKDYEIEDLFSNETLEHKIDGKSFSRDENYDKTTHYEKNKFSQYIYNNYKKIDFTEFQNIFKSINDIIEDYKNTQS